MNAIANGRLGNIACFLAKGGLNDLMVGYT